MDKRSGGFGRISAVAPKKVRERQQTVPGFQNISGAQLFPPLRGKAPSYGDARALVRRHMVTARHYKPRIERYPITLATENEPYPSIPNAMAIKVSHGKDGPIEEPRLAHFEFYSMDGAQDIKPKLATFGLFREARITNGLDRDSLDPGSPWFFDWVTLERLPPGVAILIEKSLRMREILEPESILGPSSRCRINREITFDCPDLLSMIGQSVGCYYSPLREYGVRDLRVDRLPSFKPGQSRAEPRNPYAHYLEEAPLQARLFAWRGSGPWEQDPSYPGRFGSLGRPFCWMLETIDPRSGVPITRRIKSDLELRRAVDLVRCQYAEGLRYALSSFDADYLIACLPLPFRRKLAGRCIGYQQDVRDFLSQYSLSPRLDHFSLALEGTVRNSERIIRALIEGQQALLEKGARLSDLPTQIQVSGDLLQVFLEAELKNLKKRETRVTGSREFLPPELPDKISSLLLRRTARMMPWPVFVSS